MSLSQLMEVLKPPANPVETGKPEEWAGIEEKLGLKLPDDYKGFIEVYGTGTIGHIIVVWNPFSLSGINLIRRALLTLDMHKPEPYGHGHWGTDTTYKFVFPYRLFPEPGGVFPFGATINGDVFYWKTIGNPNEWTIVIHFHYVPDRNFEFEEHPYSFSEYIARLIKNEISTTQLYETDLNSDAGFQTLELD